MQAELLGFRVALLIKRREKKYPRTRTYLNALAITPNGQYAYVTNNGANGVQLINTTTNSIIVTESVGNGPIGEAITPNNQFVYVTNSADNSIDMINQTALLVAPLVIVSPSL